MYIGVVVCSDNSYAHRVSCRHLKLSRDKECWGNGPIKNQMVYCKGLIINFIEADI